MAVFLFTVCFQATSESSEMGSYPKETNCIIESTLKRDHWSVVLLYSEFRLGVKKVLDRAEIEAEVIGTKLRIFDDVSVAQTWEAQLDRAF